MIVERLETIDLDAECFAVGLHKELGRNYSSSLMEAHVQAYIVMCGGRNHFKIPQYFKVLGPKSLSEC